MKEPSKQSEYAVNVVDSSHAWYRKAAIRSRRLHRSSEIATIGLSAAIPLCAVLFATSAVIPAVLGSLVVIITGLKSIFQWQENYLRFSRAREAVEAERRSYHVGSGPYSDPAKRSTVLVERVTRIEQEEMGKWADLVSAAPKPNPATGTTIQRLAD